MNGGVMRFIIGFVLSLSVLFLTSCAVATSATPLGGAGSVKRPPIAAKDVLIYRTAEQVPGQYEEIALLHSSGDTAYTDESMMYDSMRQKAGAIGANAIILDAMSEPSAGAKVAAAIFGPFGTGATRHGKAVAIYVNSPEFKMAQDAKLAAATVTRISTLASAILTVRKESPSVYESASSLDELRSAVIRYVRGEEVTDAWGTPLRFEKTSDGFRIVSAGADKAFDPASWSAPDDALTDFAADAVITADASRGVLTRKWRQ
jgi:hypothetical protein